MQTPVSRAITRDGCPVELYRRLPYCGEVKAFSPAVPHGASVLELGCGVGRMTRALIDSGFQVTAVDNSGEMLSFAPSSASLILSDIETLRIDRTFDVVLLASCLINVPSETECSAYLATCRHHFFARALDEFAVNRRLAGSGLAVVKWLDPRQTWGLAGRADHEPDGEPR